jgi:hypothetical protein
MVIYMFVTFFFFQVEQRNSVRDRMYNTKPSTPYCQCHTLTEQAGLIVMIQTYIWEVLSFPKFLHANTVVGLLPSKS